MEWTLPKGPFVPTWDSLKHYDVPRWYMDGKFGIFIHWGVYSVPAFGNEWYPRRMYLEGTEEYKHHIKTYGPQAEFGYKDFVPKFKAEKFDPEHWAELFRKAGARFVVPVAEHHDGIAMYDCSYSDWTTVKMGPQRDIIGELAEAVRKQWMVFGLSSHRAEHWWFYDGGMKFDSDVQDARLADLYGPAEPRDSQPNQQFLDDWLARTCELVDRYRPQLVWFDWWIEQPSFEEYLKRFAAYYYNRGYEWDRGVAINYKLKAYPEDAAVFDVERGQLDDIRPLFWQTDTAVAKNSWGYVQNQDYKTVSSIIGDLVDIVSKNGALLLNIGPRPDGTIPEQEEKMLLEIGNWLSINGEAIYDTRPWKCFGEGPTEVTSGSFADTKRKEFTSKDIRFTIRGTEDDYELYSIVLAFPENGEVTIQSLGTDFRLYNRRIESVHILDGSMFEGEGVTGTGVPCKWSRRAKGLHVKLPCINPPSPKNAKNDRKGLPITLKIKTAT